jgi:hypothetical protein
MLSDQGTDLWLIKLGGIPAEPGGGNASTDGGFIMAGVRHPLHGNGFDCWLVKTDTEGVEMWNRTFGHDEDNKPHSILQSPDGGLVVAGDKDWFSEQGTDFWLIKWGGIPAEPEGGDASTDGEPVQTPDIPGFGAAVAVIGLLVLGNSLLRRRIY